MRKSVFLLVLLWSISSDTISNDAPDINYNYGNIGPQEFAFDEKWKAEG